MVVLFKKKTFGFSEGVILLSRSGARLKKEANLVHDKQKMDNR